MFPLLPPYLGLLRKSCILNIGSHSLIKRSHFTWSIGKRTHLLLQVTHNVTDDHDAREAVQGWQATPLRLGLLAAKRKKKELFPKKTLTKRRAKILSVLNKKAWLSTWCGRIDLSSLLSYFCSFWTAVERKKVSI